MCECQDELWLAGRCNSDPIFPPSHPSSLLECQQRKIPDPLPAVPFCRSRGWLHHHSFVAFVFIPVMSKQFLMIKIRIDERRWHENTHARVYIEFAGEGVPLIAFIQDLVHLVVTVRFAMFDDASENLPFCLINEHVLFCTMEVYSWHWSLSDCCTTGVRWHTQ